MKQWALGFELGISQQEISKLERQETIPDEILFQITKVLNVSIDMVKSFDEDTLICNINESNNKFQKKQLFIEQENGEYKQKIVQLYEGLLKVLEKEKEKLGSNT